MIWPLPTSPTLSQTIISPFYHSPQAKNGLLSAPWTSQAFTVSAPLHLPLSPHKHSATVSSKHGWFLAHPSDLSSSPTWKHLPLVYYLRKPHGSPTPKLSCGPISFLTLRKIWNDLICRPKPESQRPRTGLLLVLLTAAFPRTDSRHGNKPSSAC